MTDRVGEIKKWLKGNYVLKWSVRDNIKWLISELEKCREETENAKDASSAKGACMKAALNQLSIARAEIDHLSIAIGGVGERFEYQRRHRKWALKKLKDKQAEIKELDRQLDIWWENTT